MSKTTKLDLAKLMTALYRCGWFAGAMYTACYCAAGFAVAITDVHWMGNALMICTAAVAAHLGRGMIANHYLRKFPEFNDVED